MKLNIYRALLFLGILVISSSFKLNHPLKLTASQVKYDSSLKKLNLECKVFIDDFENSINKTLSKNINVYNLTKADKAGIQKYFEKHYVITINEKVLSMKYLTSKVEKAENGINIKFYKNNVKLKKGDKLKIKNTLFINEFGMNQLNRITVRIPPFIEKESTVCHKRMPTISYTL